MQKYPIKVLAISLDRGLAVGDGYGDVEERHKAYAEMVSSWRTMVLARGWFKFGKRRLVENSWVDLVQTPGPVPLGMILFALIKGWMRRREFDVVTAQDPFLTGMVGWLISKITAEPLNIQLHSDFFQNPNWRAQSFKNRLMFPVGWWLIKRADSLRVDNSRKKRWLIKKVPALRGKIFVAPMAVDLQFFSRKIAEQKNKKTKERENGRVIRQGEKGKFTFVFVGRLSWEKNLGMLIRVFGRVSKHYPRTRLVLVGEGEERGKLEAVIKNLGLEGKVKLAGFQPREMVREYLWRSDVFVLPSKYEGWGLVAVEASAAGLPVIMCDTGCAGEAIIDGENGLIVPVDDEERLEEKMIALINDKQLYAKLAEKGSKVVRRLLDPGRLRKAWIEGLVQTKKQV
jgi:glycosyltransferase involved in cell wall biosynthesis